jgi:EmrB/QacA subfamily drug resistance transporter
MSEDTVAAAVEPAADPRRWRALAVLALVQFMLILDITVVNVALPDIQTGLGFSRAGLVWVVDGYTLTAGGLLLLGGRLADLLGRKRMFLAGIALFTLASIFSGAAQNPGELVASRFLQGAGEALASPAAFGLVALLFSNAKERATALGIFGGVAGLGGTFGPVVSGLLLKTGTWRWIFFVNVPVAVIAGALVWLWVDESRAERRPGGSRPDVIGAVLATAGLTGIVYGLIQAGDNHPWGSTQVLVPFLVGLAVVGLFVLVEARIADPLVPLQFFRNRTRVAANVTTLFFSSTFFVGFFLLTLYLEEIQHWSALKTGLAYLPFGVAIGIGIGLGSGLVTKLGIKPLMLTGFVLVGVGALLFARISVGGDYPGEVLPAMIVSGFGSGLAFMGFGNAAVHQVSLEDASLASGVQNSLQQIGGAIGLAVLASIALRHTAGAIARGVNPAHATVDGYRLAFIIGAIIAFVGAAVLLVLMEHVFPEDRPEPNSAAAADPAAA